MELSMDMYIRIVIITCLFLSDGVVNSIDIIRHL